MALVSGVPQQIGGKWVGFTDFTELALQGPGAIPGGLTLRGNVFPNAPNSFAVVLDGTVGRYLSMSGQGTSHWGISYDAFDEKITYGEFVARIWLGVNTGNRRTLGPAMMSADAVATHDLVGGHVFKRSSVDFESEIGFYLNGGGDSSALAADMKVAEQAGVWVWVRWQKFIGNPVANDGHLIKSWYGNFSDEPDGWDATSVGVQQFLNTTKLGWGSNAVFSDVEERIAYFAFTEDPSINVVPIPGGAGPAPGDIVAPTVTVDPRQDRWVGLKGSAFALVP